MLIECSRAMELDPLTRMLFPDAWKSTHRIDKGLYEIGHFGSSEFLRGLEQYPEGLSVGPYGVCDSPEQLLEACPELRESARQFVVVFTRVRRADQSPEGGWRWHKWGDYIGSQTPTTEYLYDEPEIEEVFCYHIHEYCREGAV